MVDLWPEILGHVEIKAPVVILREQASLLGEKTRNIVQAAVVQSEANPFQPADFNYGFNIIAPALANYSYRLFGIWHNVDLYPVQFEVSKEMLEELRPSISDSQSVTTRRVTGRAVPVVVAASEAAFMDVLREILHSKKAMRVIRGILAQSGTWSGDESPF